MNEFVNLINIKSSLHNECIIYYYNKYKNKSCLPVCCSPTATFWCSGSDCDIGRIILIEGPLRLEGE